MKIKILEKALFKSWSKDTCYQPMEEKWTPKNPAWGQCYITALIVNDYFGGKILKTKFEDGTGHFWNLVDNKEIDLTRSQFDENEIISKPTIHSRDEIENNPKYKKYNQKYLILKKRVQKFLSEHN
jgi:catalase (peroxidase I)